MDLKLFEIIGHLKATNFYVDDDELEEGVIPLELWTCKGNGLFSEGAEGFKLDGICTCGERTMEIDNMNDLSFLAEAPNYIKYLLKKIEEAYE